MNSIEQNQKKDVICTCSGTTQTQIQTLVAEGIEDIERICQITGACTGCGGCEPEVLALLMKSPAPAH